MDACSVFSKDIITDQNCPYLFHAQKHKHDLWAQLRWGVTSQMLSRWCPRRAASCLFERQHRPIPWQIFTSSLGCNSPVQETILDSLLTSLLPCKSHLFHDLKPAHPVLAVIVHLQIPIQYSPVNTSLKENATYRKKKTSEPINTIFSRSDSAGQICNVFRTPVQFWEAKSSSAEPCSGTLHLSFPSSQELPFSFPTQVLPLLWN